MDFLPLFLKPWPQRGLAFIFGAVGALAFAPLFIFPAILLALSGIWFFLNRALERQKSFWAVFWLGWWFGLGHFTVGLYWISHALTVDLSTFWWLIPFALFGIPAILGVFTGVSFMAVRLWPYDGISRAFAFAALWVGVEWLRGHLFTGFPWNLVGYAWAFSPEMVQTASLGGVYGLSLLTVLLGISLNYMTAKGSFERTIVLTVYLVTVLGWVWGHVRLENPDVAASQPLAIRLVQPSIPQVLKWDPEQKEENFKELLTLTARPSHLPLKTIIWPETAVPFFLEQEDFRRQLISNVIPQGGLLFTGALHRTPPGVVPGEIWNSLLVLNDQGNIVVHYDKFHLVPFGEYIPFRNLMDSLFGKGSVKKITAGMMDFTPGPGPKTTVLPGDFPSFSGLVCYEVIFPGAVIHPTHARPAWMINVTNDGWYGRTSGPYQHLEMARFRAVEEGIPLIRAANSGISAVFDAYGQSLGSLGLGAKGVLDVFLPSPTRVVPFYGQWGDWITLILIAGTFGLAWSFSFKRRAR
ncbi:MAG: apolipoprotein N-acyltransferase [Alphaproteobacteria bacterium]|nr:apolipoprotein N-acyltransferase [Alphaproteobacteria bacterium]